MNRFEIYDHLFIRKDIDWPENDRAAEPKIARLANLIIGRDGGDTGFSFWKEYDIQTRTGKMLVYLEFQKNALETTFSLPEWAHILTNVEEGLKIWKATKSVRFNEEALSFIGVGPSSSRRFAPVGYQALLKVSRTTIPDIAAALPPELEEILKQYNEARAAAEHSEFKDQKREE